jgi:hypothetical protein
LRHSAVFQINNSKLSPNAQLLSSAAYSSYQHPIVLHSSPHNALPCPLPTFTRRSSKLSFHNVINVISYSSSSVFTQCSLNCLLILLLLYNVGFSGIVVSNLYSEHYLVITCKLYRNNPSVATKFWFFSEFSTYWIYYVLPEDSQAVRNIW